MELIVFGAGRMGREFMWQISSQLGEEYKILGFVDDSAEKINTVINGYKLSVIPNGCSAIISRLLLRLL